MKNFNELCATVEELDPLEYGITIAAKTAKIKHALDELTEDPEQSEAMLAAFLIASVYADGKLDESEYLLMMPALKLFFGEDFDYDSAKALVKEFKPEGKELKRIVDYVVDLLGEVSEDLKNDIIIVCLLICAIDGKVTTKEKNYIKQLIR